MLKDFLKQTCNVKRNITINNNGLVSKTTNIIYSGISCYVYYTNSKLDDTNIAENTSIGSLKMLCEPDKTNMQKGDIVEVTDPDLGFIGTYQINSVKMNRFIRGNNSLEITLSNF